jgi:uncharacterized damage-inducible protein DinB
MAISDALLPEFDQKMAGVRKTVERVPADKSDWQPHEKSWSMMRLAGHLANRVGWTSMTIGIEQLDVPPGGEPMATPPTPTSVAELLATFDTHAAEARAAMAGASDETLMQPWTLLHNDQTTLSMLKIAVLRTFVMNYAIHHRAQLDS